MEIRFQPNQPVRLSVLSGLPQTLTASIVHLDGRDARLQAPQPIPAGSAIRIDLDDSMLLGEITGCISEQEQYGIQVNITEAIPSMSDLARLVSALMCHGPSESLGDRRTARAAASIK
jgi:hypothetical protein